VVKELLEMMDGRDSFKMHQISILAIIKNSSKIIFSQSILLPLVLEIYRIIGLEQHQLPKEHPLIILMLLKIPIEQQWE